MLPKKFYQHTLPQPFHLSVGALVFNEEYKICTHHLFIEDVPESLHFLGGGLSEWCHVMRESLESEETLEEAIHRGVEEEFGMKGVVDKYLGSLMCEVQKKADGEETFQKTTLYYSVRLKEIGKREVSDEESVSSLEWLTPKELLDIYTFQREHTSRPELDESEIIQRFIDAYEL